MSLVAPPQWVKIPLLEKLFADLELDYQLRQVQVSEIDMPLSLSNQARPWGAPIRKDLTERYENYLGDTDPFPACVVANITSQPKGENEVVGERKDPTVTNVSLEFAQSIFDMRFLEGSARAVLTMSDDRTQTFQWFHDEITYVVKDFQGKTMEEIRAMHRERDIKYLQS